MEKSINGSIQPNLPRHLFWDQRYDDLDWQNGYNSIIARVIERGTKQEWEELIRFYSQSKVLQALQHEIKFLPDYTIEDVCLYFNLQKEQLLCYTRKQSRKGHWL
jgi:hypothetical protein